MRKRVIAFVVAMMMAVTASADVTKVPIDGDVYEGLRAQHVKEQRAHGKVQMIVGGVLFAFAGGMALTSGILFGISARVDQNGKTPFGKRDELFGLWMPIFTGASAGAGTVIGTIFMAAGAVEKHEADTLPAVEVRF